METEVPLLRHYENVTHRATALGLEAEQCTVIRDVLGTAPAERLLVEVLYNIVYQDCKHPEEVAEAALAALGYPVEPREED